MEFQLFTHYQSEFISENGDKTAAKFTYLPGFLAYSAVNIILTSAIFIHIPALYTRACIMQMH